MGEVRYAINRTYRIRERDNFSYRNFITNKFELATCMILLPVPAGVYCNSIKQTR